MKHKYLLLFFVLGITSLKAQTYAYGSYTGTGVAKTITGLAFTPACLIIKSGGAYAAYITTTGMGDNNAKTMGATATATETGIITDMTADGFSVGTDSKTNNSGTQYHWIAFAESSNIHVGTYVGNADWSAETVTGCGFQPEAVIVWGNAAAAHADVAICLNVMGSGSDEGMFTYTNTFTNAADFINTYDADGFTTGSSASAPIWGTTYYYIAFNEAGTTVAENSYNPGAEVDNQTIAINGGGGNFQPDFCIVKRSAQSPVMRIASMTAASDVSLSFTATSVESDLIQDFAATGIKIGTNDRVQEANQAHYYFAMGGGTSLPVELLNFDGKKFNNDIKLYWSTATEINSERFDITRSTDGKTFEKIGQVSAAGNSTSLLNYEFTDQAPLAGQLYYQLVEHDFDGKTQKSSVITLAIENATTQITQLFPNPVKNEASFSFTSNNGGLHKLQVIDNRGNVVYFAHITGIVGENRCKLFLNDLEQGSYLVRLYDSSGVSTTTTLIKRD